MCSFDPVPGYQPGGNCHSASRIRLRVIGAHLDYKRVCKPALHLCNRGDEVDLREPGLLLRTQMR